MSKRYLLCIGVLCVLSAAAHAQDPPPLPTLADVQQVTVSVKVIEFQTERGVETGLSAYFLNRSLLPQQAGIVSSGGHVRSADITFPAADAAITVFLDRLKLGETDFDLVLQALVRQERAFILSQPKAMVTVGSAVPTVIQTSQRVPYENTVVVGATAVQTTAFRDTGVSLTVSAPELTDDDGSWTTSDDTYIKLQVAVEVKEEGTRIPIAFDNQAAPIMVPQFVARSANTTVWVRNGQVLILGGLYRNTKDKSLSTLPWLTQGEDLVMGVADRVLPGHDVLGSPLSTTFGNRKTSEGRRELVFFIKAELWRPAFTVMDDFGFAEEEGKKKVSLTGVIEEISEIPQGIVEGISREGDKGDDIQSNLGGGR